jgi:hypothetical protein
MDQKTAIEKMTVLRNAVNRLPDSDEKRTSLPIIEEFLRLATKDYDPIEEIKKAVSEGRPVTVQKIEPDKENKTDGTSEE